MDQPFCLILTGPPGAGKTTVGRSVANRFNPSVCIESDWFWSTITNGFIRQWKVEADPQNRTVIRSFIAAAARMVAGGYPTVVEGVVGPWYLGLVRDELRKVGISAHYLVLRPDLDTCLSRASARGHYERVPGHPPLADEEPIRMLWTAFSDLYESHALDTTSMSVDQTSDVVIEQLDGRGGELMLR